MIAREKIGMRADGNPESWDLFDAGWRPVDVYLMEHGHGDKLFTVMDAVASVLAPHVASHMTDANLNELQRAFIQELANRGVTGAEVCFFVRINRTVNLYFRPART